MKTQTFNFEETQKNCNFDQSDLTDCLSHERFNQALKQCKIGSPSLKLAEKNRQKVDDKPKEPKTNIPIVRKKIEMEISTQVSTQRKRPISQVTVAPTKKLSKHTLEKLKKF
jgi:ribosome maturation protein Sdo1